MNNSGLIEALFRKHHSLFPVIVGMAPRAGHHVNPEPFQLFEKGRLCCRIGPFGHGVMSLEVLVNAGLEIDKTGIRVIEDLAELKKTFLPEDRKTTREDAIPSKSDSERTGL
jgi:hypothetical protein